jgi:ABC-type molybdate transport system substrate-binding protein
MSRLAVSTPARRITTGQEPCDIFASADFEIMDLMLKPAGFADYDILFGQGEMVLAYTTSSKNAATITAPGGVFNPRRPFWLSPTIGICS